MAIYYIILHSRIAHSSYRSKIRKSPGSLPPTLTLSCLGKSPHPVCLWPRPARHDGRRAICFENNSLRAEQKSYGISSLHENVLHRKTFHGCHPSQSLSGPTL